MRSLYLRIWLTVVAALALFALVSGWLWQGHLEQERARFEAGANDRLAAWAELVQRALPPVDAPAGEQAESLRDWSARLRMPLALDDRRGLRIGASPQGALGAARARCLVLSLFTAPHSRPPRARLPEPARRRQ
jgi:hypothetical protein